MKYDSSETLRSFFFFFSLGILSPIFARSTWLQSPAFTVQSGVGRRLLSPFFCGGGLFRMPKKYKVSEENHAKPAGVVEIDTFFGGARKSLDSHSNLQA